MTKRLNELTVLDRCKQQLATIKDLPTLLEIRDKAKAIAAFQKAQKGGHETSNYGKSIASLAEAHSGNLIIEGQADGTIAGKGQPEKVMSSDVTLLSDLGISRNESSRMQTAAVVLNDEPGWFDEQLEECNESGTDFTQQLVVRKGREIKNAKTKERKTPTPKGKYDVIVIDPPWPMEKIEREVRPNQSSAIDYPVMTEEELAVLKLPSGPNCHMWLWTTHKFLPMALRLIPQWKFKYVCTFVWHKPGGFQPVGLPQYNCEFALYCRKGAPKFKTTKALPVCFNAPRGKHSEKPSEFYEVVSRVTSGKRIDMFSRRDIKGFTGWGNES